LYLISGGSCVDDDVESATAATDADAGHHGVANARRLPWSSSSWRSRQDTVCH